MGLDMYAYKVERRYVKDSFGVKEDAPRTEIFYWRKHHDLHGWMETLYRMKGGPDEVFNCSSMELTLKDLDNLEAAVRNYELPETEGFFFGHFPPNEESVRNDLEFIGIARETIKEGYAVFYDSWW